MNIGGFHPIGAGGAEASAREASLRHAAQSAGSVDGAAEGHGAADRDADGRQAWLLEEEKRRHGASAESEQAEPLAGDSEACSLDPTRQRGGRLDLSG